MVPSGTHLLAVLGALVLQCAPAISQTTTTTAVLSGTPIPGNYTGPLRPQIHYSPPVDYMNDPNGLHRDANGTWHMYYQYDPTGDVSGNQHWGHATSTDLYHWINQEIAIFAINASSYIYTGSAVVDVNNTSGFFPDQNNGVVAIFTIATVDPVNTESQGVAYSVDGGFSFEMYSGNPVIDIDSPNFRDPKVFWYDDHWVMAVSYAAEGTIGIYTSPDLTTWTFSSNFTTPTLTGRTTECPNLVEVPVTDSTGAYTGESMYVFQIGIQSGSPYGGSTMVYYVGTFDGSSFTPVSLTEQLPDFGEDTYAGQFWGGLQTGEAIAIAWATNLAYSGSVPTGTLEGWVSAMSLPRNISVRTNPDGSYSMVSTMIDLSPVLGDVLAQTTVNNGTLTLDYSNVSSGALLLNVNFEGLASPIYTGSLDIEFSSPVSGESLLASLSLASATFTINRTNTLAFQQSNYADVFSNTASNISISLGEAPTFAFSTVIDRSIFETFLDGGNATSTTTFYTNNPLTALNVVTAALPHGVSVAVSVNAINSAWAQYEDATGTVLGNVTAS